MDKHIIFLSFTNEDSGFATALKDVINDAFVETLNVFVSSDSLRPGDPWLQVIQEHLQKAHLYISVLSPRSVDKRWILFEAGAAFGRNVKLISVCVHGLRLADLESPFRDWQALPLDSLEALHGLLREIADHFNCNYKRTTKLLNKALELAREDPDCPPRLSPAARQIEGEFRSEVVASMTELSPDRRVFWETLDEAYGEYRKEHGGLPETIAKLASAAPPPTGIPLSPELHLRDYPRTADGLALRGDARCILDFCTAIYPPKQDGHTLQEYSIIPDAKFDAFHNARGGHARLWRQIGQRIYLARSLGFDTVTDEFSAQRPMLNLLTYLEIALVQWTQDEGPGKHWLFRLNRDWATEKSIKEGNITMA